MPVRRSSLVAVLALLFVAAGVRAESPAGVWAGDNVTVVVFECPGSYSGHIDLAGQRLPFTRAGANARALSGRFIHQGAPFEFVLAFTGNDGTIKSGTGVRPIKRTATDPYEFVTGQVDRKDYAAMWATLQPLIDQNAPHALFVKGLAIDKGWGVPADPAESLKAYLRATDAGSVLAPLNAGNCYRDGRGTAVDFDKAFKLFQTAAMRGDSVGGLNAGALILNGKLGPIDDAEGCAWLMLSSEPDATDALGRITPKLTPEQFARAKARNAELMKQRADVLGRGPATGTIRMTLELRDGKATIASCPPGSSMAKNDGQPGDVLMEVDSTLVAGKSLEQVQALLDGRAGSSIHMRFDRAGQNIEIICPREPKDGK